MKKKWSRPLKSLGEYLGKKRENKREQNGHEAVEGASVSNHDPSVLEDETYHCGKDVNESHPKIVAQTESPGRQRSPFFLGRIRKSREQTTFLFKRGRPSTTTISGTSEAATLPSSSSENKQPQRPSLLRPPSGSNLMVDLPPKQNRSPSILQSQIQSTGPPDSRQSDSLEVEILTEEQQSRVRNTDQLDDISETISLGNAAEQQNQTARPLHGPTMVLVDDQHKSFPRLRDINTPSHQKISRSRKLIGKAAHESQMTIKLSNISEEDNSDDELQGKGLHNTSRKSPGPDPGNTNLCPRAPETSTSSASKIEDFQRRVPDRTASEPTTSTRTHKQGSIRRRAPERSTSESTSSNRSSKEPIRESRKTTRSRSRSQDSKKGHRRSHHTTENKNKDEIGPSSKQEPLHSILNIPLVTKPAKDVLESPRKEIGGVSWKDTIAMHERFPVGLPTMERQQSPSRIEKSKVCEREIGGRSTNRSSSESRSRSPTKRKKSKHESHKSLDCYPGVDDEARKTVRRSKSDNDGKKSNGKNDATTVRRLNNESTDRLLYTSPKLVERRYKSPLEGSCLQMVAPPRRTDDTDILHENDKNSRSDRKNKSIDRHISESPGRRPRKSSAISMDGSVRSHRSYGTRGSTSSSGVLFVSPIASKSTLDHLSAPHTDGKKREAYRIRHGRYRHADRHASANTAPLVSSNADSERVTRSRSPHRTRKSSSRLHKSPSQRKSPNRHTKYSEGCSSRYHSSRSPGTRPRHQRITALHVPESPDIRDLEKYLNWRQKIEDDEVGDYRQASLGEPTTES